MIRRADRPLTGPVRSRAYRADSTVNEPEAKLGRRPKAGDYSYQDLRDRWRGQPAVTVDLNAGRSGARTFEDPDELEAFARELRQAAGWLRVELALDKQPPETELPGMWESADFTGGQDEVRPCCVRATGCPGTATPSSGGVPALVPAPSDCS